MDWKDIYKTESKCFIKETINVLSTKTTKTNATQQENTAKQYKIFFLSYSATFDDD